MAKPGQRQILKKLYERRDILDNLIELMQAYAPYARPDDPSSAGRNDGAIHLVKTDVAAPVVAVPVVAAPGSFTSAAAPAMPAAGTTAAPATSAPPAQPRVLIVSPEPVMCEGFRALITSGSLRLVAACTSMAQALQQLDTARPDVAVVHLSASGALDEIPALLKRAPDCAVALWVEKVSTDMVGRAIKIGARGILPTILPSEQVFESLLAISQGEMRINLPAKICSPMRQQVRLSAGQKRLVSLIGQGLKNKEIATLTGSTEGTVKTSLNRLFKVLGAKDRFEVALYSLQTQSAGNSVTETPVFGVAPAERTADTRSAGPIAL